MITRLSPGTWGSVIGVLRFTCVRGNKELRAGWGQSEGVAPGKRQGRDGGWSTRSRRKEVAGLQGYQPSNTTS